MIVEAGKSGSCQKPAGWKPREEWILQEWMKSQGSLEANPSSLGEPQSFIVRPSTHWLMPTHIPQSSLLHSKSTGLNVNHIKKTKQNKKPSQQPLDWCLTDCWALDPARLTHGINHEHMVTDTNRFGCSVPLFLMDLSGCEVHWIRQP